MPPFRAQAGVTLAMSAGGLKPALRHMRSRDASPAVTLAAAPSESSARVSVAPPAPFGVSTQRLRFRLDENSVAGHWRPRGGAACWALVPRGGAVSSTVLRDFEVVGKICPPCICSWYDLQMIGLILQFIRYIRKSQSRLDIQCKSAKLFDRHGVKTVSTTNKH